MATRILPPDTGSNGQGDPADTATLPPLPPAAGAAVPPAQEWRAIVADVENLVSATTALTGEDLARARLRLMERVLAAQAALARTGAAVADGARRTATATDDYVHARPWKAVGIGAATAAALGMLVGFLLARRT